MPKEFDDQAVIARCLAGEQEAWRMLVENYQGMVYSVARRFARLSADDAVQEIFLNVYRDLHTYHGEYGNNGGRAKFKSWLWKVARNVSCRIAEKRGLVFEYDDNFMETYKGRSGFDHIASEEYATIVHKALALIRPSFRKALKLRMAGKSYKEIAEIMKVPLKTVETYYIYKGKINLRKALEEMGVADTLAVEFNEKSSTARRKELLRVGSYYAAKRREAKTQTSFPGKKREVKKTRKTKAITEAMGENRAYI